jgi:hypothetical protein
VKDSIVGDCLFFDPYTADCAKRLGAGFCFLLDSQCNSFCFFQNKVLWFMRSCLNFMQQLFVV